MISNIRTTRGNIRTIDIIKSIREMQEDHMGRRINIKARIITKVRPIKIKDSTPLTSKKTTFIKLIIVTPGILTALRMVVILQIRHLFISNLRCKGLSSPFLVEDKAIKTAVSTFSQKIRVVEPPITPLLRII